MTDGLEDVFVATCDDEIYDTVKKFGGKAIMTADTYERPSDRTAEAAESIDADIIVMVQGDEPLVYPKMIEMSIQPLIDDLDIVCSNLTSKIADEVEFRSPNTIKVVLDKEGFALYFSREPIPTTARTAFAEGIPAYKQVCIIPFRKEFLLKFAALEPTALEQLESIDMIRVLEYGYRVKMVETEFETQAVDTPDDLSLVEKIMVKDPLFEEYSS
jgi:3-deoxy-manno-octulosonate cytidylyltransferase (CMP-KDO synthetase)